MKILTNAEYKKLINGGDVDPRIKEYEATIADLKKENLNLAKDHEILIKREEAKQEAKLIEATAKLNKEIQELTISKNNSEKECEILTKAFENLGFDVKDMKSILDKLVDGLIAKNQIQMISTKE